MLDALMGKLEDILCELEGQRIRCRKKQDRENNMHSFGIGETSPKGRKEGVLCLPETPRNYHACLMLRIESSIRVLCENIISEQNNLIKKVSDFERPALLLKAADKELNPEHGIEGSKKILEQEESARYCVVNALFNLEKDIVQKLERTRTNKDSEAVENDSRIFFYHHPESYDTTGTLGHDSSNDKELLNNIGYGKHSLHEMKSTRLRHSTDFHEGDLSQKILGIHSQLLRSIEAQEAALINILVPYYHSSQNTQSSKNIMKENVLALPRSNGEKPKKLRDALELLRKNIKKHEERLEDKRTMFFVDTLVQGPIEDDMKFLRILEDTIKTFENLENADFLKLSVQFRLAKRYIENIIKLKKSLLAKEYYRL